MFTQEAVERVFLFELQNLDLFTSRPSDPPALGPINVFENIARSTIGDSSTEWADRQVVRFQIIEIDIYFPSGNSSSSIEVVPFLSRINPAGIEAGGAGGAYDMETDAADTWGSFGRQVAYHDPFTQAGGNRIRISTGCAELIALCAKAGGSHANARAYGIRERRGGI